MNATIPSGGATAPVTFAATFMGYVATAVDLTLFVQQCGLVASMLDCAPGDLVNITYYDGEKKRLTRGDTTGLKKRRVRLPGPNGKSRGQGHFGNQISVLVALPAARCFANVKVFRNGTVQMTGAKCEEHARLAVQAIGAELRRLGESVATGVLDAPEETISIEMLNSNFRMPFKINNRALLGIMLAQHGHMCIYEPCIYPGIKIKYYWNSAQQKEPGVCQCASPCWASKPPRARTKDAAVPERCKKITAVVFQTGSVAIFGAVSMAQRDEVYDFLVKVLQDNRAAIEHQDAALASQKIELAALIHRGKAAGKAVVQQYSSFKFAGHGALRQTGGG